MGESIGALEAVQASLMEVPQDRVGIRVMASGAGDLTKKQVDAAVMAIDKRSRRRHRLEDRTFGDEIHEPYILTFGNVKIGKAERTLAQRWKFQIKQFDIIYELLDFVKGVMLERLGAVDEWEDVGEAECKAVFGNQKGSAAGFEVSDGEINGKGSLAIFRKGKKVHFGEITTLKYFKKTVETVTKGNECGIAIKDFEFKKDDRIVCQVLKEKKLDLARKDGALALEAYVKKAEKSHDLDMDEEEEVQELLEQLEYDPNFNKENIGRNVAEE